MNISQFCSQAVDNSSWVCSENMLAATVGIATAVTTIGLFGILYAKSFRNKSECPHNGKAFPLFSPGSLQNGGNDIFSNVAVYLPIEALSALRKINHTAKQLTEPQLEQSLELTYLNEALSQVEKLQQLPKNIQNLPRINRNISIFRDFLKWRSTLLIWGEIAKNLDIQKGVPDLSSLTSLEEYRDQAKDFEKWVRTHGENQNCFTLYLNDMGITDISALTSLKHLRQLVLLRNCVKDLSPLIKLTDLNSLDLSYNNIEDVSPLKHLIKLRNLHLASNKIKDISGLANLLKLNQLVLSENCIKDISSLANLKDLRCLFLRDNRIKDISSLANLKYLFYLNLERNYIKDASVLKDLQKLDHLYVKGNSIRDFSFLNSLNTRFVDVLLEKS